MTALALLAPDQRAVLELVLRQDRSYGELSELLAIPEREVRDRAESALRSLAGDPGDPGIDTGRITDWLLGQQTERASAATAERVGGHEPSRAWAGRAAERLREVGGERVPAMPDEGPSRKATAPGEGRPRKPAAPVESAAAAAALEPAAPRPRPLRDSQPRAAVRAGEPAAPRTGDPAPRVSRLGGAILIGVVALVLFGLLVWPVNLLGLGDDDDPSPAASAAPTPTATAGSGAEAQATGNDIVLRGVNGSGAEGLMRLFKAENGGVQFAIGAQNVPNNKKNESYAVWLAGTGGKPRLLGFPQTQVTRGLLTVGGPGKRDQDTFPQWFATYEKVLITRETTAKPKQPGPAILEGTLPAGQ